MFNVTVGLPGVYAGVRVYNTSSGLPNPEEPALRNSYVAAAWASMGLTSLLNVTLMVLIAWMVCPWLSMNAGSVAVTVGTEVSELSPRNS